MYHPDFVVCSFMENSIGLKRVNITFFIAAGPSRNRPEAAAAAAKRYDPSKIYGAPVVRKSKENR